MVDKVLEVYAQQAEFVSSPARLLMFSGGINSGKTWAGALRVLRFMGEVVPGAPGFIVAPTFRILRDAVLPTLTGILESVDLQFTMRRSDMELRLENGSRALLRSADNPDHLRGPTLAWAWIDEPADCPPDTGPVVLARLRHPKVQGGMGYLWLTGTPRGRRNWVYRFISDSAFKVVRASTADNPFRPAGFLETLKRFYSPTYAAQELEGKFVELTGLVFPDFRREVHVSEEAEKVPGVPFFWAIDDGFTEDHPRVILWVQQLGPRDFRVFDEYYATYEVSEESIRKCLAKHGKPQAAYLDPSAAELASRLWRADIDTVRPRHDVEEGCKLLASLIFPADGKPGLLLHPRCTRLAYELENFHRDREGRIVKADDHGPDALRYLVWGRRVMILFEAA